MAKLFPKYLNEGSNGSAVLALQLMLKAMEGPASAIIADGDYTIGGETGNSIAALQGRHGLIKDRHFGPLTRKAFFEETGIDVDTLDAESFIVGTTAPGEGKKEVEAVREPEGEPEFVS